MHYKIYSVILLTVLYATSTQCLRNRRLSRTVAEMSSLLRDLQASRASVRSTRSENSNNVRQHTSPDVESSTAGSIDYDNEDLPQKVRLTASDDSEDEPVNLTRMHQEAIELRKAQIRKAIINKLRLDSLPRPPVPNVVHQFPQHILNMNRMQMDSPAAGSQGDHYHAKIKTMLRFPQPVPDIKAQLVASDRRDSTMFFALPLTISKENLKKAVLMVYVQVPAGKAGTHITVNLTTNRITKNRQLYSRTIRLPSRGKWIHIDITNECNAWLRNEWQNNLGVFATAYLDGVNLIDYSSSRSISNETIDRVPLVKLELKDYNPAVSKRSLDAMPLHCEPEDNEARCCRYNFVLDFDELGSEFDFIISPKRYYANYCAGNCPSYILPNNLPLVMGFRRKVQRCCTPSVVSPLTLIYHDERGGIMQSELPGMSISECSCE